MNDDEIFAFLRKEILADLEYKGDISDEELDEHIAEKISKYSKEHYIPLNKKVLLGKQLLHSMRKLDIRNI